MKNVVYFFFLITIIFSFWSCDQNKFNTSKELVDYLVDENNECLKQLTINGVNISLMNRPTDLLISQEIDGELRGEDFQKKIDSLRRKYNKHYYFNLKISNRSKDILTSIASDKYTYQNMVRMLSFGMRNKVYMLADGKDSIPLQEYIYSRMYNFSKKSDFLLAFNKDSIENNTQSLSIILKDIGLGTGDVTFDFDKDNLDKERVIY